MYIREYYLPKKDDTVLQSVDPNSGKKASSVLHQMIGKTIVVKNLPANAGNTRDIKDTSSIPGLGRSPGERNCNPLQYSCLGNLKDRGGWWATVHGIARSRTRLHD